MKKFTAILLTVIMVASLFTSCSNSIAPTITDETVSVSFTEATSRSLTASLDAFDADDYYWAYKAVKKDDTGLISGQTNFAWAKTGNNTPSDDDTGLAGVTIPGFSQGVWEFTLYAYTNDGKGNTSYKTTGLAYSGVTTTTLQKGSSNIIKVTVNPYTSGKGTLIVDVENIEIIPQKSDSSKFDQDNFSKIVTVSKLSTGDVQTGTDNTFSLSAGTYKVTVDIIKDNIVYASGSVVATVYGNMTTTVTGSLEEYIVPAQFDPAINPDVMNKVVYSDSINADSSNDVVINKKSGTETDSKVSATIPNVVAQDALFKAIEENEDSAGSTSANTSIAFSMSVDTTKATNTSLNLEIGMTAIITVTESETSSKQISKDISNLKNYVTVEIQLQTGLQNVVVTHDSAEMQKLTSLNEAITNENGAYYYADSGLLTIKTKRFSPYAITYTVPEEAYVAEMNGVKYTSVQAAINAAPYNAGESVSTITLLSNVIAGPSFGFPDPENKEDKGKNIYLDLNGNTYTFKSPAMGSDGYETQAMHLAKDNTLTVKNGTLNVAIDNNEIKMLIQNYCDLTLENVIVDGTNLLGTTCYTMSNNNGNVVIKDSTIIAKDKGFAFDVCRYASYTGPFVTVEGDSVINGKVGLSCSGEKEGAVHKLLIKGGVFKGNFVFDDSHSNINSCPNLEIEITGGSFTDLAFAINHASSGITIKLAEDVTSGSGIGSKDGAKVRDNITVDLDNHTYTVRTNPVGSVGTECQAMHLGTSLGSITLKNGTIKVKPVIARDFTQGMQNYIDFIAENMTFDLSGISYNYCMFNNNSNGNMSLNNCNVIVRSTNTCGIFAGGASVTFTDCNIDGYVSLPKEFNFKVKNTNISKSVKSYEDYGKEIITETDSEGYTVYKHQATQEDLSN